jgi:putative transposase
MRNSKVSETQIVSILKEVEAGIPVKEVCRKHGISSPITTNGKPGMAAWALQS